VRIQAVEINMEVFGAHFANMDDEEQAAFFKSLARELKLWKSTYHGQLQFHSVGKHLTKEDKEMLDEVVACAWYNGEGE